MVHTIQAEDAMADVRFWIVGTHRAPRLLGTHARRRLRAARPDDPTVIIARGDGSDVMRGFVVNTFPWAAITGGIRGDRARAREAFKARFDGLALRLSSVPLENAAAKVQAAELAGLIIQDVP
jgi:hypothetical protein